MSSLAEKIHPIVARRPSRWRKRRALSASLAKYLFAALVCLLNPLIASAATTITTANPATPASGAEHSQPESRDLERFAEVTPDAGSSTDASTGLGLTVLVLGDSISAAYGIQRSNGWVALLSDRLAKHYPGSRVINASVSGETTGGGLARLPTALAAAEIDVVVIELGGNDGLRGYPTATIEDNLKAMVRLSQNAGAKALLFGMQIPPNYGPRYTQAFHQAFHDVASQTGAALLPFFLEQVAVNPELMQRDGIHPTAEAQALLLDTAWPLIDAAAVQLTQGSSAPEQPTLLSLTKNSSDAPSAQDSSDATP